MTLYVMETCSFGLEQYLPMVTILIHEICISVSKTYWARSSEVKGGLCTDKLELSLKKGIFELDFCLTMTNLTNRQACIFGLDLHWTAGYMIIAEGNICLLDLPFSTDITASHCSSIFIICTLYCSS